MGRLLRDGWRMLWPVLFAAWIGWILHRPEPLIIVLAVLLAWQVWQKWRLARWLARGDLLDPPHAGGLWEDYYTRLMHLFRTEQRAQESMSAIIERVRHCADSLEDGVLLMNHKGGLDYGNQAAFTLLDLQRRDYGDMLVKLLRNPPLRAWLEAGDFRQPLILPAPVGKRMLSYRANALGNGDVLLRVDDVTRLHRLENLRRDFVANVSHELKTPLTVFKGYLELLQDHLAAEATPAISEALTQMQAHSERMNLLVHDLLLLSRLESTPIKQSESLFLDTLFEALRDDMMLQATHKRQQLDWDVKPGLQLQGVRDELDSALRNLLGNAIKYTPTDGRIRVRAWRDADGVHVAVSDTGPGIDARHLPHLAERFYRVDDSRRSDTGGTGLGLAIVKHVLQRHHAHLDIESTPGKGSCFTCHFPPMGMGMSVGDLLAR